MLVKVKVIPNSKENSIIKEKGTLVVKVKAKARRGQANLATIILLQKYFGEPVKLVKGRRSKFKVFEVIQP